MEILIPIPEPIPATNKGAHQSNNDILIDNLQYPNTIYDISLASFNIHDMSNSYVDISAVTRPSDFVTNDISQNIPDINVSSLVLNINSSQMMKILLILKIMLLIIVVIMEPMQLHPQEHFVPTIKTAHSTNTDVDFTDLSANTFYDLSAHLINDEDISNNKIVASGTTHPTNFVESHISRNIGDTTQTKLVMNVDNHQVAGTLKINKYVFDISGTNGTNASLQTVDKTPTNQLAESSNTDVSLNDLSANTLYENETSCLMKMI